MAQVEATEAIDAEKMICRQGTHQQQPSRALEAPSTSVREPKEGDRGEGWVSVNLGSQAL